MNKAKLILTFIFISGVVVVGLYLISRSANRKKSAKLEHINKGYGYSKGIIEQKKSYKGHSIDIRYQISGKVYNYTGGWDSNPHNLQKGDSIMFKYALDSPELIITELDNEY